MSDQAPGHGKTSEYKKLPDDLKKIIDDNDGLHLAKTVGKAWDRAVARSRRTDVPGMDR